MSFILESNETSLLLDELPRRDRKGIYHAKTKARPTWTFWNLVAALFGVLAVALGAYGAHVFRPQNQDFEKVFETANKYHMYHTLLLAFAPYTRRPNIVGLLCTAGILSFCESCYLSAVTENKSVSFPYAPIGGFCFMGAWAALAF